MLESTVRFLKKAKNSTTESGHVEFNKTAPYTHVEQNIKNILLQLEKEKLEYVNVNFKTNKRKLEILYSLLGQINRITLSSYLGPVDQEKNIKEIFDEYQETHLNDKYFFVGTRVKQLFDIYCTTKCDQKIKEQLAVSAVTNLGQRH